jgi:hypothetical protein
MRTVNRVINAGNPLRIRTHIVKRLTVRVVIEGRTVQRFTVRAQKGCYYSPENIEKVLEQVCANVEKVFPKLEFKLVPLQDFCFNVVSIGVKDFA